MNSQVKVYNWHNVLMAQYPSRQILVLGTSRGRPPPTSPGSPPKILFDRPGDVPIWRPGDILKWRPGDALVWRSRDVPGIGIALDGGQVLEIKTFL